MAIPTSISDNVDYAGIVRGNCFKVSCRCVVYTWTSNSSDIRCQFCSCRPGHHALIRSTSRTQTSTPNSLGPMLGSPMFSPQAFNPNLASPLSSQSYINPSAQLYSEFHPSGNYSSRYPEQSSFRSENSAFQPLGRGKKTARASEFCNFKFTFSDKALSFMQGKNNAKSHAHTNLARKEIGEMLNNCIPMGEGKSAARKEHMNTFFDALMEAYPDSHAWRLTKKGNSSTRVIDPFAYPDQKLFRNSCVNAASTLRRNSRKSKSDIAVGLEDVKVFSPKFEFGDESTHSSVP